MADNAIITLTGRELDLILDALNWIARDDEPSNHTAGFAALIAKLEAVADALQSRATINKEASK